MSRSKTGQAVLEYILVMSLVSFIGLTFVTRATEFFRDTLGGFASIVNIHLRTGVCESFCFFKGYKNNTL